MTYDSVRITRSKNNTQLFRFFTSDFFRGSVRTVLLLTDKNENVVVVHIQLATLDYFIV